MLSIASQQPEMSNSTPLASRPAKNVSAQNVSRMISVLDLIELLEQVRMDLMKSHLVEAMNFTTEVIENLYRSLQALQQEVC